MKKIIITLLLGLLFVANISPSFAQSPSPAQVTQPSPVVDDGDNSPDAIQFITDPPQIATSDAPDNYISDFTQSVKISFPNLAPGGNYKICFRTDHCIGDWAIQQLSEDRLNQIITQVGIKPSQMNEVRLDDNKSDAKGGGAILGPDNSITVCGRGNNDLYYGSDCDPKNNHYFHAGNFYLITVYQKGDTYVSVARGGFYVSHGAPKVDVDPKINLTPGQHFTVSISQSVIRPGGNNRNDYEVVLSGPGFGGDGTKNECDHVDSPNQPRIFNFPLAQGSHYVKADKPDLVNSGYTLPGKYQFQINEQNHDGHLGDDCSGGYRYMVITCIIDKDPKIAKCKDPVKDPKGEDATNLLNLLNVINGVDKNGSPLPCNKAHPLVSNPLDCNSIDTAIGPIALNPIGFITRLFSIVLAFAGVGAVFLIIFSGYRLLLSRGNKEIIQGARETLTAAIVGLLFIVFSLVILSVIAGDILKIPGFSG